MFIDRRGYVDVAISKDRLPDVFSALKDRAISARGNAERLDDLALVAHGMKLVSAHGTYGWRYAAAIYDWARGKVDQLQKARCQDLRDRF